ncbi:MAG: hypothetical protein ACXW25_13465, partial [Rhodospirillales bacterium]
MTTIFVLDDLEAIRSHIKDRLSDIPSLEILDGTRHELLKRLGAGEKLPDPICIVTDFYTGSDDM